MAREQYVSTAVADIVKIGRAMFQDDYRQGCVASFQKLFDRFPATGPPIIPSDKVEGIVDFFHGILQEADPGLIKKSDRVGAVQIMISGNSVDAVFRLQP